MEPRAELTEALKLLDIKNECREKDEDFIKYALEKALTHEKILPLPLIKNYLETKHSITSGVKYNMTVDMMEKDKLTLESFCFYANQTIAFAPSEARLLAFAHAKRAEAFLRSGMYEEALEDIEKALQTGYPEKMIANLYIMKVRTLIALYKMDKVAEVLATAKKWIPKMDEGPQKKAEDDITELSVVLKKYEPDGEFSKALLFFPHLFFPEVIQRDNSKFLPTNRKEYEKEKEKEKKFEKLADCVTLNYDDKLGYYLAASRDIKAGEPLLENRVFAMVLKNDQRYLRCWNCTKFCWYCVPCKECANVIFCSDGCRDLALLQFHDIECQILSILLKHRNTYDEQSLMSLRLFIKALKEKNSIQNLEEYIRKIEEEKSVKSWVNNEGYKNNIYRSVYYLFREPMEKKSKDKHAFASVYYMYCLAATTEIFGKKIKNYEELMGLDSTLFVGKLLFHNAMIVSSNMIPLKQFTLCNNAKIYGGVIHPILSLRNHSCNPNSYQFFSKDKVAFTAMQCIKAGQPISTSYGPSCFKLSTDERRDILFNKHGFKCECEACINDWGPSKRFPSCLNHFKDEDDYYVARDLVNEMPTFALVKWNSERKIEVPETRIMEIMTELFKLMNKHDKTKPQRCIKMETAKRYLCILYDFIDCFEM